MSLLCLTNESDWTSPIFKVLANNDTGNAPGHQGGVVIPEPLRKYFPPLQGTTSEAHPTVDLRLQAELFAENEPLEIVNTRYQFQTWGGARSPESRITDQLGPLRKLARGGDILVIQTKKNESKHIRLTLVRTSSANYHELAPYIAGRRWGEVFDGKNYDSPEPEKKPEIQIEAVQDDDFEPVLPFWAMVAFISRCARRFLECYQNDLTRSSSQRATVSQAVKLVEAAVARGGDPTKLDVIDLSHEILDLYDIEATHAALLGLEVAADNAYSDLHEDDGLERHVARQLVAVCLARLCFSVAFIRDDEQFATAKEKIKLAIDWSVWGEEETSSAVQKDLDALRQEVSQKDIRDNDPVSLEFFPDLWPNGRPHGWPSHQLSFRPRARIIRTIGDRLVSGPEAAVIELVKNSYDADASYVKITFGPPIDINSGSITFEDDGHGMTYHDIEQKWMEPATSEKRDKRLSKKGRRVLGSKGIGRFAAARLGRFLELQSTAALPSTTADASSSQNIRQTTRIPSLDWNLFEDVKYLEDVSFEANSWLDDSETGTKLNVSSLRDAWSANRVVKLHEELRKLISPIQRSTNHPFRIFLDLSRCTIENSAFDGPTLFGYETNSDAELTYEVKPYPLLDACDYAVDGVFDESGRFEGTVTIKRGGQEPEHVTLDVPLQQDEGEEPCGVVLVRLHIFDRENNAILNTVANAGFPSVGIREARKLLDSIAGVAIYREGFRIRPYGDGENDWLTLDAKRVQNPSLRIGRNQIAGIVTVDDEQNSFLVERSSREGLEENGNFKRLQTLISTLLAQVVEPKRRQFRISAGLDSKPETSFRDIYDRVQMGWSKILLAKLSDADRPAAEELVAKETERLAAYVKQLEDRQAQLEARVTLGLIIGEVMHQGNTPLSFIETETSRLIKWWPNLFDSTEKALEKQRSIPRILNGMHASGDKLRTLFNALNPLSGARRGNPVSYQVNLVVEQTLFLFKSKIETGGITVEVLLDNPELTALGYADDLATALTNLVDNSIYWLDYHHVAEPRITISITLTPSDKLSIEVSDNGVGIPSEFSDQLFDIGFTLKPHGTGLGLSIAKEAILRSNGTIELSRIANGTSFSIELPTT